MSTEPDTIEDGKEYYRDLHKLGRQILESLDKLSGETPLPLLKPV